MNTAKLLDYLWQGGQFAYYWTAPAKRSYWFRVDKPGKIPGGQQNIYFGVNPVGAIPGTNAHGKPQARQFIRSQNDYISSINAVFGEFDLKDFGTAEAIFNHLNKFPRASVTIFSGGGYHLYWFLEKPFMIDTEADRERAKNAQSNWVACTGSDKQSKDLARVLRVPGTRNCKPQYAPYFPVVSIIESTEKTYTLEYLEAFSAPPPLPEPAPLPRPTRQATSDDRTWYAQHALRVAGDLIRQAVDGEKHGTLLRAARLLGGYAAGGILCEHDAVQYLEAEIKNKANVNSLNGAFKTIRDGIEYGKAEPITLEKKLAEREMRLNVSAPVIPQNADRRYWSRQFEGYWERVR